MGQSMDTAHRACAEQRRGLAVSAVSWEWLLGKGAVDKMWLSLLAHIGLPWTAVKALPLN